MTNVVSIAGRTRRNYDKTDSHKLYQEVKDILTGPDSANETDMAIQSEQLRELEALSSNILYRRLKLRHRKEAAAREWATEEDSIAAEMEAAVYLAYAHGVPEEAIHDLNDEHLSNALQSAMTKAVTA